MIWDVNYQRGQEVIALDLNREPHRVRVWTEAGNSIFVASEEVFSALERGECDRWPVAVPRSDISPVER
jgi:hypothetical protein